MLLSFNFQGQRHSAYGTTSQANTNSTMGSGSSTPSYSTVSSSSLPPRPPVVPPAAPAPSGAPAQNVWAQRSEFYHDVLPGSEAEEMAMLHAALEMSRLEAEAQLLARKL